MLLNNNQKLELYCVIVFSLFFIILLQIHLMSALIAGLLTYTLTLKLDIFLSSKMNRFSNKSKLISVLLLSIVISIIFIGGFSYLFGWFVGMAKNPNQAMYNIQSIIDSISSTLPDNIKEYLPDDINEIKYTIILYLKEHVLYLQSIIKRIFHTLIILIIGMIIGLIFGFQENRRNLKEQNIIEYTPLTQTLKICLNRLVLVFQYVAISQVMIALFNATMTAIFLFIILPIFTIYLPFSKSLVIATFIFGLIPIIGNIIVNILMFFVAFTVSFKVALIVLLYLILIHKFEYILNAKIVGSKIHAGICELLIAMLFFETLFGVVGLIFAPIFYAFLKLSLKELELI